MSSFNRRTLLLMPLALAACGFEPVYAPGGSGSALNGKVEVSAPNTVESFLLVQNLERQLGRSATSGNAYKLDVKVSTNTRRTSITTANETNRYTIDGSATYALKSNATGQIIASGSVSDFVGYSAAGSTVSTLADERDATERLMVILSDQIVNRLYATPGLPA
ncbi:LPS-assembly lipoprotein [Ruegeria halocynthiae]|uniref:LPS-assembly lipoprotein n=1 Tax=Ruegeria halocynthiae TaxID=985054 RepID=A0A1H3BZV5_9RHOB|nr:LPS assembly lipoprotein LptE [Ruegeria halocynthiae]SDX47447.1 LPS-assembly lipoprotein [Ruegeria halocynthiae]